VRDNKKTLDSLQVDTVDEESRIWVKRMNELAEIEEEKRTNPVLVTFPNGWTAVTLLTEKALRREGKLMHNCIADYWNKVKVSNYMVISFRDKDNTPHLTFGLQMRQGDGMLKFEGGKPKIDAVVQLFPNQLRGNCERAIFKEDEKEMVEAVLKQLELVGKPCFTPCTVKKKKSSSEETPTEKEYTFVYNGSPARNRDDDDEDDEETYAQRRRRELREAREAREEDAEVAAAQRLAAAATDDVTDDAFWDNNF